MYNQDLKKYNFHILIIDDDQKINTLAMIAPVTNEEKQKLLETIKA